MKNYLLTIVCCLFAISFLHAQSAPNTISGLQLWLDAGDVNANGTSPASGTAVNTWKDKSGFGHDAIVLNSSVQPLRNEGPGTFVTNQINGQPVVHFTRTDDFNGSVYRVPTLDIRAVALPNITIFTVYKQGALSTPVYGQPSDQAIWGVDNGGWDRFFMTSFPSLPGSALNGGVAYGTYAVSIINSGTVGATQLLTAVYQHYVKGGSAVYFNGGIVKSFSDSTDPTAAQTDLRIGWDGDNNTYNGDIAEMLVYNRALTTCEILTINRYFGAKYGVTFSSASIDASGPTTLAAGGSVTLTSHTTGTAYQWLLNGAAIPSATAQSYTASASGKYQVVVTNTCNDTSAVTKVCVDNSSTTTIGICPTALPYTWNGHSYTTGGTYTVHLTNAGGCDSAATLVLNVFSATFAATMPQQVCWGGYATTVVKTANGVSPYQFSLNGGAPVTLPSYHIVNLQAGSYSYTITDASGCTIKTQSLTITQPAAELTASVQSSVINCTADSAAVTAKATGGYSTGYLYSFNGAAYTGSNTYTARFTGTYSVTVKDQFGCVSKPAKVTVPRFTAGYTAASSKQVCYGGFTYIVGLAANGTQPYMYSLNGGAYKNTSDYQLVAGVYDLKITDAAGCADTIAITITQPANKLTVKVNQQNATCTSAANGSITAIAAGSYGNYMYSLNGGGYQASGIFTGLSAGTDLLKVKDEYGCTLTSAVTITQPTVPCTGQALTLKVIQPAALKVTTYPNPSHGEFTLVLQGGNSKYKAAVTVRDMYGNAAYQTTGSIFDTYRFGGSFASGVYLVEVRNGNDVQTVKLVKAR